MESVDQKIAKGRAHIAINHVFFASLMGFLKFEPCDSIDTADVDGITLRYNPAYIETLTAPEIIGLIAHEILHCALGHVWRLGSRDPKRWNMACDYVINGMLVKAGFTLPKGALLDPQYDGMGADQVYAMLPQQNEDGEESGGFGEMRQPSQGSAQGDAQGDQSDESDDTQGNGNQPAHGALDPAELDALKDQWDVATTQAENLQRANNAGKDPGGISAATKAERQAIVDWRVILRRFIATAPPSDYAWHKPDRRHVHNGLYLPSLVSDKLGEIVVMRDTSGSTIVAQSQFMAELREIIGDVQPAKTHVIDCDTAISDVAEYQAGESIPEMYCGGGGTDFRPPFAYVDEQGINPVCAIYLTDLDGPFPDSEPSYPVLWISCNRDPNERAPFGDTVHMGATLYNR